MSEPKKPQPYSLKLANSRRRLLSLCRSYGRAWEAHSRGVSNTNEIAGYEEALEEHVLEHGTLMNLSRGL